MNDKLNKILKNDQPEINRLESMFNMQTEKYRFIHLLHSITPSEFEKSYNILVSGGWVPLGNPVFGMGKQNEHCFCQLATNKMHCAMINVLVGDEKTGTLHEGAPKNDFYIGKYLVTIAHWDHVRHWAIQNGYDLPDKATENHVKLSHSQAVSGVSFYEACKWCNAKSEMEGLEPVYKIWREDDPRTTKLSDFHKHITFRAGTPDEDENMEDFTGKSGYRLPSQCEWEWAANGGLFKNSTRFSGSDNFDEVGWESERGPRFGVGEKKPNALGIYDMSGLSHEWCWDSRDGKQMYRNGHLFAVSGKEVQDGSLKVMDFGFQSPAYGGQGHGFRIVKSSGCAAPVFKL